MFTLLSEPALTIFGYIVSNAELELASLNSYSGDLGVPSNNLFDNYYSFIPSVDNEFFWVFIQDSDEDGCGTLDEFADLGRNEKYIQKLYPKHNSPILGGVLEPKIVLNDNDNNFTLLIEAGKTSKRINSSFIL